jgi:hypothetical protein
MKIKLVLFFSEGPPHDNAKSLSYPNQLMIDKYRNSFDEIISYSPRILKQLGYGDFCKEYENAGVCSGPARQQMIGFCAWKPLIIKLELQKCDKDDIIVYNDVNCLRYPIYLEFKNIKENILSILSKCKYDFFFPQEHENALKHWCKRNVLVELGEDHIFNYNFSQVCVNFMIAKNTKITFDLLNEWQEACMNERFIDGETYGYTQLKEFVFSCPEQSILNNILANWIRKRKNNIDVRYPFIYLWDRDINNHCPITNYSYLQYLV